MAQRTIFIYGLYDDSGIRYIGKTYHLEQRYREHISISRNQNNTHRSNWINKLKREDKKPQMIVLEETNDNQQEMRERTWIAFGKNIGWQLTNTSDGGDGIAPGSVPWNKGKRGIYSNASLVRMREGCKDRTFNDDTRKKISVSNKATHAKKLAAEYAYWREILNRQQTSGLCATDFCSRENLNVDTFYARRYRFNEMNRGVISR
jgi:GIY-YIG catalytic domain